MNWRLVISLVFSGLLLSVSVSIFACGATAQNGTPGQLSVPRANLGGWEKDSYILDLLHHVLTLTEEEFGPCVVVPSDQRVTRMRSTALISSNRGVDLFWGTTSIERETVLRPIRVPLLKGLMSYKVLLIHKDAAERFAQVRSLSDLQVLRAGQGADWPDVHILQHNDIQVVTSSNYDTLARMLSAGRFDFFPRGATEVLPEMEQLFNMPIALETTLVLVYPAPVYFFVNIENMTLAKRLETGLQLMMADGSFDDFFNSHPTIVKTLHKLKLNQRRTIYLHNPLLPPGTPLGMDEYWLYPWGKLLNH